MGNTTRACGVCNSSKSFNQFYKSPIDGIFLPMCKNCAKNKYKEYTQVVGSESAALWMVLAQLGIPFLSEIWLNIEPSVATAAPNTDVIMLYLKALNESGKVVHGFWESDVMLDQLTETLVDRESETESMDLIEQQKIWGKFLDKDGNLDIEAYEYLNQTFDDYTKDLLEMDTNLERRYRDVAKAELKKRRADESGDMQEISKAQDSLKKILDMLKLSDFSNQEVDERKKFIDRLAWMIEETEPAELEDEEAYRDIQGYEKIYNDWMRSMQNMCAGTKNYPDIPKAET